MSRHHSCTALRWLLILLLFAIPQSLSAETSSLRVVVSVKPLHSIVAGLMQGIEGPVLLIDDDTLPYRYTPDSDAIELLKEADLLFWVGPELEPGLAQSLQSLDTPRLERIELLSNRELKILPSRSDPDQRDPVFWLDNRNVLILLDDITRLLQDRDPMRAHLYERNRRQMLERLARIDREYEYGYRGMKAGLGVQYYDTLQYFEQAYALKILAHAGGSPLQPLQAGDLLTARQRLVSGEAVCLLSEKGMPTDNIDLVLQGTAANHGILNSFGVGMQPGPDLYFELMDYNTDQIKRCLNADMQLAEQARAEAQAETSAHPVGNGLGGGQFLLTDHHGRVVSPETMRGKYVILYFGYTYCPDICPTSLQVLSQALHLLGDEANRIQPYFITIDPERDTIEKMRDYVQYYDNRLIGLTGSREMIDRVASIYKARYEKVVEDGGDPDLYLMDHSASLYLLDPDGRFLRKFAHGISPADLAKELRASMH
ncbi:MAG: SCO family protein [Candidatus Thiodiazotropha sp.]